MDKQSQDIKYLTAQLVQLKTQVDQLNHLNNLLNCQIMDLVSRQNPSNSLFVEVVGKVCREIAKQYSRINNLIEERNNINAKMLVYEKIMEEAQASQRVAFQNIREQLETLKKYVEDREVKIRNYEQKIGQVDYLSSLVTKFVKISQPSELSLEFKKQLSQMNEYLMVQQDTIEQLTKEKENLLKINMALKGQIQKNKDDIVRLRQQSIMMQSFHNGDESMDQSRGGMTFATFASKKNTDACFFQFQRKAIVEESDSDFDPENLCPQLSVLFPDKVQKITGKNHEIPRLNMQKVRILMKKNRVKIQNDSKKNVHVNPTEKIIMLQGQLEYTRKQLSKTILQQKLIEDESQRNRTKISELEARNELLVQAYRKFKDTWQKIHKEHFFLKRIYEQWKECQQPSEKQDISAALFGLSTRKTERIRCRSIK